jgi:DAK2 domain fusion protein YloV
MSDAHRIAVAAARGAAAAVEASRGRLNDLNVYPVPDGDTGSNLSETAHELAAGLADATAETPAAVATAAKRAVLMGASGNSGAILSQIVGGFADVAGAAGEIDSHVLARALRSAADAAYRPVQQPIEGTMLTVIREMAEAAERLAGGGLDEVVDAVLAAGGESVARTQGMLDVLRDAGVVDAGAAGLVEFCRGAVAGARGEQIQAPLEALERPLSFEAVHQEESQFRYCTSFLVEGEDIDRDRLEAELLAMGDCLLVVGEAPMCRVHVHTDDPGAALTRAVAMGSLDRVAIANMQEQTRRREERLSAGPTLVALPGGRADEGGLTAENTAIVLDSTADVAHPEQEHANWRMVPLTVRFGEEQFEDYREIEPAEFYRRLRNGGPHPQTAAPSPGAYLRMYEKLSEYAHVIVLPVSSKVSGSVQAARIAAEDPAAGGRVTVLDGRTVSVGTAMLADGVQRLLEDGTTLEEVTAWVESARERLRLVIYVDTLEYLRRGGRISRRGELAGNAIGLRPLLTLRDGELALYRRVVGGRRRALREFDRFLCQNSAPDGEVRVALAHGADPDGAEGLAAAVRRLRPQARIERVSELGAVVGTHGGPGTLGLLVLAEP